MYSRLANQQDVITCVCVGVRYLSTTHSFLLMFSSLCLLVVVRCAELKHRNYSLLPP